MSSNQPKTHGGGLGKPTSLGRFLVEEYFFMTQRQRAHPKSGICSHCCWCYVRMLAESLTEETKCAFCEIKIVFTVTVVQSE